MSYAKRKKEESLEDYLETILILKDKLPVVRSIDIAHKMSFSKPSVSIAMKNLKNSGYIQVSEEGYITLTDIGKDLAEKVYDRHTLLSDWLISLGVNPEIAKSDACKIEHDLSQESFNAIKNSFKTK